MWNVVTPIVKLRPSSSRSRAAREKEEKQKEEEAAAAAAAAKEAEGGNLLGEGLNKPPFVPPGDNILIQYIEEVSEKISPLPTSRDQVMALAQ